MTNIYMLEHVEYLGMCYYSMVLVTADSEEEAKLVRPDGEQWGKEWYSYWVSDVNDLEVTLIGTTEIYSPNILITKNYREG